MNQVRTYKFDTSSTMNMTLYKPLNGAPAGNFTLQAGSWRIKRMRLFGEAMIRDSNNADYSTDVMLNAVINGPSTIFVNANSGLTAGVKNGETLEFDGVLTAGQYSLVASASPVLFRNPNHTEAAPVTWTHTSVSWTMILELEQVEPNLTRRQML